MNLGISWESALRTISQILSAGVAITAFSLLLYVLAYNLRERVVKPFLLILLCVAIVYTGETIASVSNQAVIIELMLRLKWFGIIFLPATYLHFSNSLLSLTGRPSRGRRLWVVRLTYIFSVILLILAFLNILVGPYEETSLPAPHLTRTFFTSLFAVYYVVVMVVAGTILYRAFQRTVTRTSRRRMIYLLSGATVAAIGTYPYLLFGSGVFANAPIVFWIFVSFSSLLVDVFLVIMTYAVAFFGVTWPDRLVKSRLFKWFLRGPFTASIVLAVTTIIRRLGMIWDDPYNAFVPFFMVGMILLMEYAVTLLAPYWEELLFFGRDRNDIKRIKSLEDHMLTRSDLSQFLEIVTATICDLLQVNGAFVGMIENERLELLTTAGDDKDFRKIEASDEILLESRKFKSGKQRDYFLWSGYFIIPLIFDDLQNGEHLLGICGFPWEETRDMEEEHLQSIQLLANRIGIALRDWRIQQQVLSSMESLDPQVALIQQLRASSSYNKTGVLLEEIELKEEDFVSWVKDALTHYWGGPKLSESPLLSLRIVQSSLKNYDGNPTNALRAVLKTAVEQVKPEGDRRFTVEWILYNILELKFMEGRKVRDVATRLAMSEADLYRKQRVALEAVSKAILGMELNARDEEQP